MKIVSLTQVKILFLHGARIIDQRDILLDPEEHTDFIWLSSLEDLEGELIVPYLLAIFADRST